MNSTKMSVTEGGHSKRLTLPKEWCDKEEVRKGRNLAVVIAGGGLLVLPPRAMSNEEIDVMMMELRTVAESVMRERGKKI